MKQFNKQAREDLKEIKALTTQYYKLVNKNLKLRAIK